MVISQREDAEKAINGRDLTIKALEKKLSEVSIWLLLDI